MHGCMMENVQKIKIKLENIWIDLIRSIYAPYRYFYQMLDIFSSLPFYTENVHLPQMGDAIPEEISENPKFFPFFRHAIGAMDGTHFNCTPTAAEHQAAQDQKGCVTQNCLAACTFDLKFIYVYSG